MFVTLPRIASMLPSVSSGARPGPRLHAAAAIAGTLAPSLLPGLALAQSVGEPAGSGPLVAALQWVEGTLLGNLATTAAVIAVAVVGLMMLTGRIDWRRGLTVILGAFIVFGAVAIVSGIRSVASGAR